MRKLRIEQWCDFCWQEREEENEATHSFALGAIESLTRTPAVKLVETCEQHSKVILDLIGVLAGAIPFVPEKIKLAGPGKRPAIAALAGPKDALFDPQPNLAALNTADELQKPPSTRRMECPVEECPTVTRRAAMPEHIWRKHVQREKPAAPTTCPDCGYENDDPRSMGTHRSSVHGFDSVADALASIPGGYHPRRLALAP